MNKRVSVRSWMSETSCCGPSIVCRTGRKGVLLLRFYEDLSVDQTAGVAGLLRRDGEEPNRAGFTAATHVPAPQSPRRALIAMELDELRQAFSRREAACANFWMSTPTN